jgi:hypothetical protein
MNRCPLIEFAEDHADECSIAVIEKKAMDFYGLNDYLSFRAPAHIFGPIARTQPKGAYTPIPFTPIAVGIRRGVTCFGALKISDTLLESSPRSAG